MLSRRQEPNSNSVSLSETLPLYTSENVKHKEKINQHAPES